MYHIKKSSYTNSKYYECLYESINWDDIDFSKFLQSYTYEYHMDMNPSVKLATVLDSVIYRVYTLLENLIFMKNTYIIF